MVQERKGYGMRWPLMGETITYIDRLKMAYFVLTAKKFTFGKKVEQFENQWSKWLGAKHSLFVSLLILIAGAIAPSKFPKCGFPLLCIPVKILAI
jgi:hypothetical protein